MEFNYGRREMNRIYTKEEQDYRAEISLREGGGGAYTFLPTSPSCSSQPSASSSEPPVAPTTTTQPSAAVEKEHMFEKVVTPSDVGKLNRLVIPKQHAEKYFPLDASSHDKGLLLNFEDRNGKPWRFRYSYWNSSQSYVMTKGWSRFVKEKRLDAGDTVSFGRGIGDAASRDRLFIDWKRRPGPHFDRPSSLRIPRFPYHQSPSSAAAHHHPYLSFARSSATPWATSRVFIPQAPPPTANYFYFRSAATLLPPPDPAQPMVLDSVPVSHGKAAASSNKIRLFGVNLEQCRDAEADVDGLLRLQLRDPLPSPELRLGIAGVEFSSAASSSSSSSRGAKDGR